MNPTTVYREAVVRTSFVGFHRWPEAGDVNGRDYLATPHRHRFDVAVSVLVRHNDREVEYHDLLDVVTGTLAAIGEPAAGQVAVRDLGRMSCEDVATEVARAVIGRWPRQTHVEVFEDGECGARLSFLPEYEG